MKYTQRQWDRTVGYGKVPEQYSAVSESYNRSTTRKTDGENSTRSEENRKEVKRVVAETNPTETHKIP